MTKRIVALSTALIAIGVFAPGIANAATVNTTATIAIQGAAGTAFGGKVNSPSAKCKSARTVVLQRKSPGSTKFVNVGSDKTPSTGDWSVNTSPISGAQYRAFVASKSLGGGDSCKAATSTTVTARQTTNTIAIGTLGNSFKGAVASSNTNCISGRHVTLQRKLTGGSFTNLSSDTSSGGGAWEVPTNPVNNAEYRGFVSAKQVGSNSCMSGTSPATTAHTTTLTIAQGGSTNFHGNVVSVQACRPNRTVTLQRKTVYETTFSNIGSDVSDGTGFWQRNTAVVSGASYRASVSARQVGTTTSCIDDLSNVIVAS